MCSGRTTCCAVLCCPLQVLLTRHHLAIVMSYAGGGDLHSYALKYTMNEEVAR